LRWFLTVVLALSFGGCTVENSLVLRNSTDRPVVVQTSKTGASVRIKVGGTAKVAHTTGKLVITQEGGAMWDYPYLAIWDYDAYLFHKRSWGFVPVNQLRLIIEPDGRLVITAKADNNNSTNITIPPTGIR
jgi:hypothetical protein